MKTKTSDELVSVTGRTIVEVDFLYREHPRYGALRDKRFYDQDLKKGGQRSVYTRNRNR